MVKKQKEEKKLIAVGIPAYKAEDHIDDCLASIQIQSISDEVQVVIASDWPEDNYEYLKERFPHLDIKIVDCEKNGGPGVARRRALENCDTEWITFIDADDVFISPMSLESLKNSIASNVIEVQGAFAQEIDQVKNLGVAQREEIMRNGGQVPPRMVPRNDVGHPWVFGRLYNVKFLKDNKITFSDLRAMEDGEFNWKIRMTIEGTPLKISILNEVVYLWRTGSEHSITRIGMEENDGEPLYNWDLCMVGSTAAAINAVKFCKKKNPFNGGVLRFTVEQMIGQYFTYVRCLEKKPMFAEQCLFNAKRFYHSVYESVEDQIDEEVLKTMYTAQYAGTAQDMINVIPQITFFDFMKKIKTDKYGGKEEFDYIRDDLPEWVIRLDKESGVLGEEGYVYTSDELESMNKEDSKETEEEVVESSEE